MPNIFKTDCGFDPLVAKIPHEVTAADLTNEDGWDLTGVTNSVIAYASTATQALAIAGFQNMIPGKEYKLIVENDAATALGVTFPNTVKAEDPNLQDAAATDPITLEEADISNGDIVEYTFYTYDGETILVSRKIFS